jgi:hypothetical protein
MTAVDTVIKKLVSDYEFVIIPGFGALLSRQVPAVYNKDSGVFSPPVKKLAFNEFLKLDDGFLANYISREEGIAHTDAIARIKQYTDDLKLALGMNGQTKIEGIGSFNTNVEGKLVFEPNVSNCFKDEWYGFAKVNVREIERQVSIKPEPTDISLNAGDVEVLEPDSDKSVKVNWLRWASAAALAGLMFYLSFFLVTTGKDSTMSTLNPFDFSDEKVATRVVEKPATALPEDKVVESLDVEKPLETTGLEIEKSNPAVSPAFHQPEEKRFYLVAGTFNSMKRANILLADLQQKGFAHATVLPAGARSKKVKVAIQGFDNESEAYAASSKLKSVIGEPGWVFEMK